MQEKTHILDRVSSFSLLLTMVILMIIGAALIPLVDVGSSPKPRQGKTLTISYGWRNASPKVVEQEVTSKIEGLVSAVKGVAEVSSESYFGSGRVTVVLKKEAVVSAVKFEISSLLKQVRKKLPEEVSYPELTGGEVVNDEGAPKENTASHLLTYQVNSNLTGEQIKEYVKAESLEQAYELNQKRTNCILGGMLWIKMSNRNVQKAIDMSGLGLNQIEETEEEFRIGCMTTLRELECHERLNQWCEGAVKDAVSDIVGVQFRNLATIGGSIFGRYGFSDVLTVFLAMDSYVELYKGGIVPLQEFAQMKRDNDFLVRVIVKKDQRNMIYLAHRNSKPDFPVLTCAVSVNAENGCVCIGARPQKAVRLELTEAVREKVWSGVCTEEEMKKEAECIASQVKQDSNKRAGKEYRSRLAYVLIRRTLEALNTKGGDQ